MAFPDWPSGAALRALMTPSGIAMDRSVTLSDVRWLLGWKRASKDPVECFSSAHQLASYSRQRLHSIAAKASLVHEQSQGQLLLLKSEVEQLAFQDRLKLLNELGAGTKLISPPEARALEPALGADLAFHAAVYFPNDEIGNCRQFAHLLKDQLQTGGAHLHFGAKVTAISRAESVHVHTETLGTSTFDAAVVCAGTGTQAMTGLGLNHVALTSLWSHSVSALIREPLNAPRSAVIDSHSRVSISRMGARIRVSGGARLGRFYSGNDEKATRLLFQTLQSLFPGAADFSRTMQIWKAASVFSPDALPLVGAGPIPGIWLNLAHGHNGWNMACGAARILADQIAGREPEIDTKKLNPTRFQS
jgi:D-amino-acid dehydrogenase